MSEMQRASCSFERTRRIAPRRSAARLSEPRALLVAVVLALIALAPSPAVDARLLSGQPGAKQNTDDAAPAEDGNDERAEPAQLLERGLAPVTPLRGGKPEREELGELWQRYAEAPSSINRDETEDECGNGGPFEWQLEWNENRGGRVQTGALTFPSAVAYGTEANRTVHAAIYRPADAAVPNNGGNAANDSEQDGSEEVDGDGAPGQLPAVVLLHHLEDDQRAERLVANFFAMRGYVAALLYFPHYGPRGADGRPDEREMMRALIGSDFPKVAQAVWDVHRLRDWLRAQEYVDDSEISLMGISLGGLVGSLSAGIDPGFSRYVFVLAGGDIARVIFNGSNETQWLLEQVREEGLTEEDLRERVRPVDPCTFAHRIDGSRVLMFNTKEDEVIPPACTEALIEAIHGKPTVHWFPGNHTAVRGRFAELLQLAYEFVESPVGERAEAEPTPDDGDVEEAE